MFPIEENVARIRAQLAEAAMACGRDPKEIRLLAATKMNDKEAIALFRHLCKEAGEPNYATTFLTDENCANWGWAKDPWPWEIGFNGSKCGKEGANHVCV